MGAPAGAETPDDLAVHYRWAQVSLTDIIGWADICPAQEDEETVPVFMIPFQESFGFGLFRQAFEQPVAKMFNPLDLR